MLPAINGDLSCEYHEEADTKIIHHICKIEDANIQNVVIKSTDTDVLIIMLGNI